MPKDAIRAFLAVEIVGEVREAFAPLLRRTKELLPGAKVVDTRNVHITLHFFAALDRHRFDAVRDAARMAATQREPFDLSLGELGAFPNEKRARVVWLGIQEGAGPLAGLASKIGASLTRSGIDVDPRPFSPHLTIARLRRPTTLPQRLQKEWEKVIGLSQGVADLVLYQSHLRPQGPLYEVQDRFPLRRSTVDNA